MGILKDFRIFGAKCQNVRRRRTVFGRSRSLKRAGNRPRGRYIPMSAFRETPKSGRRRKSKARILLIIYRYFL